MFTGIGLFMALFGMLMILLSLLVANNTAATVKVSATPEQIWMRYTSATLGAKPAHVSYWSNYYQVA